MDRNLYELNHALSSAATTVDHSLPGNAGINVLTQHTVLQVWRWAD